MATTDKCDLELGISRLTLMFYVWRIITQDYVKGVVTHTEKSNIHPHSGKGGEIVVEPQQVRKV